MKLVYQWIIVALLTAWLFVMRFYGGPACSKPVAHMKIVRPPQIVIVKPLDRPAIERGPTPDPEVKSAVPSVPNTPSSKQKRKRRHKITKKQRESFARRLSQAIDDPEWMFVHQGSL